MTEEAKTVAGGGWTVGRRSIKRNVVRNISLCTQKQLKTNNVFPLLPPKHKDKTMSALTFKSLPLNWSLLHLDSSWFVLKASLQLMGQLFCCWRHDASAVFSHHSVTCFAWRVNSVKWKPWSPTVEERSNLPLTSPLSIAAPQNLLKGQFTPKFHNTDFSSYL